MGRWRFFWLRLAFTVAALSLVSGVTLLLWHPGVYSALAGAHKLLLVLAAVTVVLGPGLTTLVYRPGKRGLRFDITAIAILELAVIGWAGHEIHARRPAYTVFAVDRFQVVTGREVRLEAVAAAGIDERAWDEPRLVFAEMPVDSAARSRLIEEVVFGGMADIDRRPEFWRPYPEGVAQVLVRARPLTELLSLADGREHAAARWLSRSDADAGDFVFLPLSGERRDATIILHSRSGLPAGIIDIDPW